MDEGGKKDNVVTEAEIRSYMKQTWKPTPSSAYGAEEPVPPNDRR